ncbi:Piso0_001375 [Millerozyma farinosa CBS 7064]|uniref:Piso0_001375 protein n=1 Tax=Pichia sorbitophila (strain ATCC MYA-4447 / BCRC 22081 / CBS 7064 / NBRC 10061 / NRRL Y-12695) TaxID=559304 RepID=G8YN00_PICSO|nr:Piso0_001375 [Millerozyma farinosa CBS 7064]
MEDARRNGIVHDNTSKRDKRRQQISTRLHKIEEGFSQDKDNFYRSSLVNLQTTLATIQQGTNEDYLERKSKIEEERDYELTKLRLWEEYQVRRIEDEYKEDLAKAQDSHDMMIKLIKEKLYDKLQRQIKQLKEDKLLLNLVNANSWNTGRSSDAALSAFNASADALHLNDRRSLRKREVSTRFTSGEMNDLSDGPGGSGNGSLFSNGYTSGSQAKRRRHYTTRYSSNDEISSGVTSNTAHAGHRGTGTHHYSGVSSGNDSNLSDKDYDALNSIIMNDEINGNSFSRLNSSRSSNKPNTRGSSKQFTGLQGLKPEELNDDLALLRSAIVKKER